MPQTFITQIRDAEEQAAKIREEGAERARDCIRQAEADEAGRLEAALQGARMKARDVVREADESAKAQVEQQKAAYQQELNAVRQDALTRMPQVVERLLERIIG